MRSPLTCPLPSLRRLARILAVALLVVPATASDVFVDPVLGSDTTGNGTAIAPWKSLTHAVTTLPAGVPTVHLAAGTYDASTGEAFPLLLPLVDGLTIRGAGPGATTLVNPTLQQALQFNSIGSSQQGGFTFTIEGLTFDGSAVRGDGSFTGLDIVMRDCVVRDANTGLYTGENASIAGEFLRFDNCETAARTSPSSSIWLTDSVIENGGRGVSSNARFTTGSSIYLTRCTLRGNQVAVDADSTFPTGGFPQADVRLNDCLVTGNGTALRGAGIATLYLIRSTVTDNQIGLEAQDTFPGSVIVVVHASILWGNASSGDLGSIGSASQSNLPAPGIGDATCLSVDPRFVDPSGGDFHLRADSPLIDQGGSLIASDPLFELDLDPRELDGDGDGLPRVDMGYDEWNPTHLSVSGAPALGQSVTFTTTAAPGSVYVLGLATSTGVLAYPPHGTVLINPASYVLVTQGMTPGVHVVSVPADPALVNLDVHLQAFTRNALSNRVDLTITP